jgi:hypothetical protein
MPQPVTRKFGQYLVKIEDPAAIGTYKAPCGFTERSITFDAGMNEQNIPDCVDPDAPVWTGREKTARSIGINGNGVLAVEDLDFWRTLWLSDNSANARIVVVGYGYWAGKLHVANISDGPVYGQKVTRGFQAASDGEWTWNPGAEP